MIALPRVLCRELHGVIRKLGRGRGVTEPVVEIISGRSGLIVHTATADVVVRYHESGRRPEVGLSVPLSALAENAGTSETLVTLRAPKNPRGNRESGRIAAVPTPPTRFTPLAMDVLAALEAAGTVTARDSATRFALNRIQLRGGRGEIVASDNKHLLLQSGFPFPWKGDVLVPRSDIFAAIRERKPTTVSVARTATHVWITAGSWSIALTIDASGSFPDVGSLLARTAKHGSELVLDPADRERLLREVPRLAGHTEGHRSVTFDLTGPLIRAGEEKKGGTIPLGKSRVQGKRLRMSCDRNYLLAALRFGFVRMTATTVDQPLVWRDATRTYLFLPLADDPGSKPAAPVRSPAATRRKNPVAVTHQPPAGRGWKPAPPQSPLPVPSPKVTPTTPRSVRTRNVRPGTHTALKPQPARGVLGGLWSSVRGFFHGRRDPRTSRKSR